MNIKHRLRKLENQAELPDSARCSCPFHFLLSGIVPGDAEIAAETDCRICGKPKDAPYNVTFRIGEGAPIGESV